MAGNQMKLLRREDAVVRALVRVAHDLIGRKIVLGDLWDGEGKREYLNHLEREGVLPTNSPIPGDENGGVVAEPVPPIATDPPNPTEPPWKSPTPVRRTTLIPADLNYGIVWSGETARLRDIWDELQHRLLLAEHPNAIGVLFRVLLDLSVTHYVNVKAVQVADRDTLATRVDRAAAHMRNDGTLEARHQVELRKLGMSEQIISAHTMNAYVHSLRFSPSPEHLTAMWTSLSGFVVRCLNA
jgi:hypothetical protein